VPQPYEKVLANLNEQVLGLCGQLDDFELMQRAVTVSLAELLPGFARKVVEVYKSEQSKTAPRSDQLLAILEAMTRESSS